MHLVWKNVLWINTCTGRPKSRRPQAVLQTVTLFYIHCAFGYTRLWVVTPLTARSGGDLGPWYGGWYGTPIWDPDLRPRFGTPIWDPDLGPWFGTPIWDPDLGPRFGTPIWAGRLGRKTWPVDLAGRLVRQTWPSDLAGSLGRQTC
jgi:hypothetical protein